jgi:SAM-dependent methyltransferase
VTRESFAALARAAASRYPSRDRFARHYAYGKLTRDPTFRFLLERGYVSPRARVLDLGAGQGVLCALLAAAKSRGICPSDVRVRGIEIAKGDAERARSVADRGDEVIHGDIRAVPFGAADVCVILDVLHYLDPDAQQDVLARVREALAAGGVLLLRVADAARGFRFHLTTACDRLALALRGHLHGAYHCRTVDEWIASLARLGFDVETIPMSAGTPFANVLLVARA